MNEALTKPDFRVEIYPSGVRVQRSGRVSLEPPAVSDRGDITNFSNKAARRLREWFMTMHVLGCCLFAVTLTTHAIFSPEEWRAICKRFRQSLIRQGFAGLWRVELQKRKAPHLHVAFWLLDDDVAVDAVRLLWLRATGEELDPHAQCYAVSAQRITQDEAGWAVYMALHNGKHKTSQLGWCGKQWGIWNRDQFIPRKPEVFELTSRQHVAFLRFLRRLETANRRRAKQVAWSKLCSMPLLSIELTNSWRRFQSLKRRGSVRLHRGNLLRLMKGETASRILRGLQSGIICHISKLCTI